MNRAISVIGAGWGDEAKGLVTAQLARSNENPIVIRHNGGAQAGHTVMREDGFRHVFSHIGAGTLEGVPTYLSKTFTANPLLLQREMKELMIGLKRRPTVFVDPLMPVSIPHDMMLNAASENVRGQNRHGSVGVGYGEAVAREDAGFVLTYDTLRSKMAISDFFDLIEKEWIPRRLEELEKTAPGIKKVWRDIPLDLKELWNNCLNDMFSLFYAVEPHEMLDFKTFIFEGAQGLRLDMDLGDFPHVTRSHTGLPNVINFLKDTKSLDISVEAVYASRCYATRHGAGPMMYEMREPPVKLFRDDTNKPHKYQGSLRFAPLDISTMKDFILKDIDRAKSMGGSILDTSMHISCLDQALDEKIPYYLNNEMKSLKSKEFVDMIDDILFNVRSTGWGAMVSDIKVKKRS